MPYRLYKRLLFLYRCIRFDNIHSRDERKKTDKLAAVREILALFEKKFELAYTPAEYTTIDEQLIPFRGRCAFRQYLPLITGIQVYHWQNGY